MVVMVHKDLLFTSELKCNHFHSTYGVANVSHYQAYRYTLHSCLCPIGATDKNMYLVLTTY